MTPDITTDRLRITPLQQSDAAALFGYSSQEQIARFQSWVPQSADEAAALIDRSAAIPFNQNETWFLLAVRSARTGELLGDLGVHFVGDDGQQVEIGFAMSPAHQRQGFAKEATRALLDHLFSVLNKHRVYASVDPSNEASLALLRSLGMRQEAHFRQSLFWKGAWVDDVVFGVLRSEWLERAPTAS